MSGRSGIRDSIASNASVRKRALARAGLVRDPKKLAVKPNHCDKAFVVIIEANVFAENEAFAQIRN